MTILSINQLTNKQKYLTLKRDFLLKDDKHNTYFRNMNPEDPDPEVDYKVDDISFMREEYTEFSDELGISYHESDGTFITLTENFYDDYLHPKIKAMYHNYVIHIRKEFEEKDILNPADIKFFGEKKTKILHSMVSNVGSANHLNTSTKELITSVFSEIIDFVYENYVNDPYNEKINFNLQKNEVVILFNLFLNNKIISDNNVLHFNEKLQKFFRYKDGKEFKDIVKAYKSYDELLGRNPQKSPMKALKSLKKRFDNPDFFVLE